MRISDLNETANIKTIKRYMSREDYHYILNMYLFILNDEIGTKRILKLKNEFEEDDIEYSSIDLAVDSKIILNSIVKEMITYTVTIVFLIHWISTIKHDARKNIRIGFDESDKVTVYYKEDPFYSIPKGSVVGASNIEDYIGACKNHLWIYIKGTFRKEIGSGFY